MIGAGGPLAGGVVTAGTDAAVDGFDGATGAGTTGAVTGNGPWVGVLTAAVSGFTGVGDGVAPDLIAGAVAGLGTVAGLGAVTGVAAWLIDATLRGARLCGFGAGAAVACAGADAAGDAAAGGAA